MYLPRSSNTTATAEPASRRATLLYIYHVLQALRSLPSRRATEPLSYVSTTFFKYYGHCRAGEPPSHSLKYLLRSSSTEATAEPASHRATLLCSYRVLQVLRPLPSRWAAEPLSYLSTSFFNTKATAEPASRRANLLHVYHVLQALRPLSSRRASL